MRSKLVLIALVVIGMFALNGVAQWALKNIGQGAIEQQTKLKG